MMALAPLKWETLPAMLDANVELYADKVALIDGTGKWTYRQLADEVEAVARALVAAGVEPGDRVAIWLPNSSRWAACAFAVWKVGAVLVPVNTRFKATELGHMLRLVEPKLLFLVDAFLGNRFAEHLETAMTALAEEGLARPVTVDCAPGSTGWDRFVAAGAAVAPAVVAERSQAVTGGSLSDIMLTSGTTGFPKGVMATQAQDVRVFLNLGGIEGMSDRDVLGIALPFFHTFGFKAGLLLGLIHGATVCIFERYDPTAMLEAIETHGITFIPGPPAIFHGLLDHPDRTRHDLSSLRLAAVGSTFVPVELVERLVRDLSFDHVQTSYGLTEATGVVTGCRIGDSVEVALNSIGRPQPELEVRIRADGQDCGEGEVGEIQVRGYNVTSGYYRDPEMTAQLKTPDGWLRTGDLGAWRADGTIAFRGRMREMLVIGGFNAYPLEIENCIRGHDAVQDVAVIGIADARMGEVPAAFVVPKDGLSLSADGLQAWTAERIANYKVPKFWRFLDALPSNASGKVVKGELAGLLPA